MTIENNKIIMRLEKKITNLESDNSKLRQQLNRYKNYHMKAKLKVDDLNLQYSKTERKNKKLIRETELLSNKIENCEKRILSLDEDLAFYKDRLNSSNDELKKLKLYTESLKTANDILKGYFETLSNYDK